MESTSSSGAALRYEQLSSGHFADLGSSLLSGPGGAERFGELCVEILVPLGRFGDGPKDGRVGLDQTARCNLVCPSLQRRCSLCTCRPHGVNHHVKNLALAGVAEHGGTIGSRRQSWGRVKPMLRSSVRWRVSLT